MKPYETKIHIVPANNKKILVMLFVKTNYSSKENYSNEPKYNFQLFLQQLKNELELVYLFALNFNNNNKMV